MPKPKIQVKVKAFAHAAVDISERGIASIHCAINDGENIIKIITVLQRAHQIKMKVRKTLLRAVLRIRDVYPGSGFFPIADPGFFPSRIPDLGSRIPDPKKHGEVKKFFYFICFLTFL